MNSRDLYAACTGMFAVLAIQQLGVYLARPTLGVAVLLVAFTLLFIAAMVAHVTSIVSQRSVEQSQRPTAREPDEPTRRRRPLASVTATRTKAKTAA